MKTLSETQASVGQTTVLSTSFYDDARRDRLNPSNTTSSGEYFRADRPDNAASPVYPDGTKLLVWNPRSKRSVVVRVNNAGPYHGRRMLDVSRNAADVLGFRKQGVASLHVRVLQAPTEREARYQRGRTYAAVPGFIGIFESFEMAFTDATRAIASLVVPSANAAVASAPRSGSVKTAAAKSGRKTYSRVAKVSSKRKYAAVSKSKRKARLARHKTRWVQQARASRRTADPARYVTSRARMSLGHQRNRM